ncbi:hypothetical protein NWP21_01240 [Anabaenopsis sp. FSS-46]|nr:hypothetical protein [Anabaenopsis sp. FSS-46]MDH6097489.1 hypothetical protein [Anabaenopsis sp. FSS-46]
MGDIKKCAISDMIHKKIPERHGSQSALDSGGSANGLIRRDS